MTGARNDARSGLRYRVHLCERHDGVGITVQEHRCRRQCQPMWRGRRILRRHLLRQPTKKRSGRALATVAAQGVGVEVSDGSQPKHAAHTKPVQRRPLQRCGRPEGQLPARRMPDQQHLLQIRACRRLRLQRPQRSQQVFPASGPATPRLPDTAILWRPDRKPLGRKCRGQWGNVCHVIGLQPAAAVYEYNKRRRLAGRRRTPEADILAGRRTVGILRAVRRGTRGQDVGEAHRHVDGLRRHHG